MVLVPFNLDPWRYEKFFLVQIGYKPLARYRGSGTQSGSGFFPQILKDIFASFAGFVHPILRLAVTYAKAALVAARPHLEEVVSDIMKEFGSKISQAISKNLNQQDKGVRKRNGVLR